MGGERNQWTDQGFDKKTAKQILAWLHGTPGVIIGSDEFGRPVAYPINSKNAARFPEDGGYKWIHGSFGKNSHLDNVVREGEIMGNKSSNRTNRFGDVTHHKRRRPQKVFVESNHHFCVDTLTFNSKDPTLTPVVVDLNVLFRAGYSLSSSANRIMTDVVYFKKPMLLPLASKDIFMCLVDQKPDIFVNTFSQEMISFLDQGDVEPIHGRIPTQILKFPDIEDHHLLKLLVATGFPLITYDVALLKHCRENNLPAYTPSSYLREFEI
ncbi:MAG: hypothetical protein AAB546_01645 [Patescibacteria group bacterium]